MRTTRRKNNLLAEIEALYRDRVAHFHRVAVAIVGEPEAARDAVQDAFASALQSIDSYRSDGPLEAWLWRVVVNAARAQRRRERPLDLRAERFEDSEGDRLERVALVLAGLPERQRLALFLRYYADLDYASIGRVLEVEAGTVASTLHQARAAIRRQLTEVTNDVFH